MKKNYEELELKVINFASKDIITASEEEQCPGRGELDEGAVARPAK